MPFCVWQVSNGPTSDGTAAGAMNDSMKVAKRNVLKTMFTVFGYLVASTTCNNAVSLLFFMGVTIDFTHGFYHFTVFAWFSNCFVNPLIYVVRYKEFKRGFQRFCVHVGLRSANKNSVAPVTATDSTPL